jgi:uncharacterized protein
MAARDVFVDTAGFVALWDASDDYHARAVELQSQLTRGRRRFLTTDYIADETATLLMIRHSHAAASDFLASVTDTRALRIEWVGQDRFDAAASLFRNRPDKGWSFTDCVSFTVMRELGLHDCFTTDHHFDQAGFVSLLKI